MFESETKKSEINYFGLFYGCLATKITYDRGYMLQTITDMNTAFE